jgi:drug/metabolite transporter (DMT)-like permease
VSPANHQPRERPVSRLGYVLVALSAAFAAANGVAGRLVIDAGVTPRELSAVRIYGAALVLLVVVVPHLRMVTRSDLLHLAPFALVGFVAGQGLYFQAISRVDIAVVLVIVFTSPLLVAVYQRLAHNDSLPHYAYGAMAVAVLGLALAVLGSGDLGSLSLLGIGLAVITMAAYSTTVLMAARPSPTLPPLIRTGTALGIAAIVWLVMVPPWTLPFSLFRETTTFAGRVGFTLPVWTALAFVVVIGTVAVYGTWIAGTSVIGAGAASVVGMAEPMLGAIFAWAFLAQSLTVVQSIGIATTAGGIIVVEQARVRGLRDAVSDVPVDL